MKVAVVGCGAVGSFYGAKLARAGHEVHFLLRSDYEVVRRKGVFIRSSQGDFRVQPKCARAPREIGPSELVLIGLKTTANAEFARLLPPLVGPATVLLTLQNGLGNEERLAGLFPSEQIMGGLCFVCLNRLEPGLIHHIDHGQVVVGEFQRRPEPRTQDIAAVLRDAGVPCTLTDNLAKAHWEKLAWNVPFNGLGVAGTAGLASLVGGQTANCEAPGTVSSSDLGAGGGDMGAGIRNPAGERVQRSGFQSQALKAHPQSGDTLTTDKLLGDAHWEQLVRELMLEVIAASRALGFDPEDSLVDALIERTRSMGAYKASTLIDFEHGRPLELESLFLEPLRQAQQAGVPVPRLEALCGALRQLDPGRHK